MVFAPLPENEQARLKALRYYEVLDSEMEAGFNDIVELAARICETPVSLITLLDERRQWFKARVGLALTETPREISFCSHTILGDDVMEVQDALNDFRFADNPLVTGDGNIRFYAGMPLSAAGLNLGSLCVIDRVPRKLTQLQMDSLRKLSRQVVNSLDLRLKVKQLNELNDRNLKMLSIIAHDIRSPLNELQSLLQLRDKSNITPEQFDFFSDRVNDSIGGTTVLLNNLIEWAISEFDQSPTSLSSVSLPMAIADVLRTNRCAIETKGNKVKLEHTEDVVILTDDKLLSFLLRNTIVNANKFTSGGTITVSYTRQHNFHNIAVTDTGVGIEKARLQNLFDWRQRLTSPGTQGEKGSGIGLRLCKELVERIGGKLSVSSEEGSGTSIVFMIPGRCVENEPVLSI